MSDPLCAREIEDHRRPSAENVDKTKVYNGPNWIFGDGYGYKYSDWGWQVKKAQRDEIFIFLQAGFGCNLSATTQSEIPIVLNFF